MMNSQDIPSGQRRQMIAEAAYFRAERRGFRDGDPVTDWIEAEKEVEEQLAAFDQQDFSERFAERLEWAGDRLKALKRRATRAKADAREALESDAQKLAELRTRLDEHIESLKRRGADVGHKSLERAEKLWQEVSELAERTASRRRPRS